MADRVTLPDWPRLMSIDMAAAYFSVSVNTFRSWGICPVEQGRRVLYCRHSLDRFADHLAGQPLAQTDQKAAASDVERAFLDRRRRG